MRVFKLGEDKIERGLILFELPLVQIHPQSLADAQKSVERWIEKSSIEILRRNGYKVDEKGRKKK